MCSIVGINKYFEPFMWDVMSTLILLSIDILSSGFFVYYAHSDYEHILFLRPVTTVT